MDRRALGRTGIEVSVIGFGCGMVGGLMVAGSARDQQQVVGEALDSGINYFDTAPFYGGGQSETHLGRALKALKREAVIGTKIRLEPAMRDDPVAWRQAGPLIAQSVEESLQRLGIECLDLLQLHNPVSTAQVGSGLHPQAVRYTVLPAFQRLVQQGKVRHIGMSALGDAASIVEVVQEGGFDTAQVSYSLLNPSAERGRAGGNVEDYGGLLEQVREARMGTIGIRLLAGGSLSGSTDRHATALSKVVPLGQGVGSGNDYAQDAALARRFAFLVEDGRARSLVSAALRYGLSNTGLHTLAIGFSSREQLQEAAQAAADGPFDARTLSEIEAVQADIGVLPPH